MTGANRHDVSQLEKVLNSIVTYRPEPTSKRPQNLCADKGYTGEPALEIIVLSPTFTKGAVALAIFQIAMNSSF